MTQAVTTQPAPTPAAPAAGAATGPAVPVASAPATPSATPERLSRWRALIALALLACTVLTATQLVLSWNALRSARADAQQLIRVQEIKVDLLRADALATNAFLVGGLEPVSQRAAYDEALAAATTQIAAAATAQGADEAALAELSGIVVRYAANMEVARSNNRQGLPVGAAYLRTASQDLRGRGMVVVDAVIDANATRAETALADQHPLWIALPGLITIGLLVAGNQWIARRFHRRINPGVAAAAALVLGAGLVATGLSALQATDNATLRDGNYADLVAGADARSAANAARSNESLRLIARGSGKTFEDAWTAQAATVVTSVRETGQADLPALWTTYADAHAELVALDDGGDWEGAVALATTQDAGSATTDFEAFDSGVATVVDQNAGAVESILGERTTVFLGAAVGALLAGLAAIVLAWRGIARRLEEYS